MEVYIFKKNKRCPYLNYGFYLDAVVQHPLNQLQLDWLKNEHKISIQFLKNWKDSLENNIKHFIESNPNNAQRKMIYVHAINNIYEIIDVLESGLEYDTYEAYIEK